MVALVVHHSLWWVPVGLIAGRELAMSVYRSYAARRGVSVPARFLAKVKTVTQEIAVGLAILPLVGDDHPRVAGALLWVAVVLTLVSGAQYLADGRKQLRAV
jgi:CDP-diacylglycerol--glycerol-3-phosphate 3-phosphatidyltransferase